MEKLYYSTFDGIYNNLSLIGTPMYYRVYILKIRRYEVTYQWNNLDVINQMKTMTTRNILSNIWELPKSSKLIW